MNSPAAKIEWICPTFRIEFIPPGINHLKIFTSYSLINEPMMSPAALIRHNSEPDLLGIPIGKFLNEWNNSKKKNEPNAVHSSSSTRLPFWPSKLNRRSQPISRQQKFQMDKARAPLCLPLPQFRHQAKFIRSPFAPLPFDLSRIRPCQQQHQSGFTVADCRDGDLLPSCWFSFDSEDLNRLHYKLQRRISRKRSLTKANCPFGEQNPGRANIIEKYQRLRGGIRRALSDHQLHFMDPKRDIGEEILQRKGGGEKGKRVSFSSPAPKKGEEGGTDLMPKTMKRNKSSSSLQLDFSSPEQLLKDVQPAKPILTRKSSVATSSSTNFLQPPNVGGAFRHRTGTIASTGHCDEYAIICPMDYATFRAWRRGSRLSIDVLNNAAAALCQSTADGGDTSRKCGKNPQHGLLGNWMGMLKKMLADCMHQKRPPATTMMMMMDPQGELSCLHPPKQQQKKAATVN